MPLTGVPGWPFNSLDGKTVIVTTWDEPAGRGYVELLDAADLTRRRVVEVAAEPFHALPLRDGAHIVVALADGSVPKISLADAAVVPGGFSAGGTMAGPLLHLPR